MTSRRDFLELAGGVVAGAALSSTPADAAPRAQPPAKPVLSPVAPGAHPMRALPFQPAKLTGISAAMIASHHTNNYGGAVKNLNKVELELAKVTKDTPGFQVAALRERELTYTNSMILHEHYFGNGTGSSPARPASGSPRSSAPRRAGRSCSAPRRSRSGAAAAG
jgi:hypothetical protein